MTAARRTRGFTLLEVMLAIGIFSMILISIYSVWTGILRASQAARTAADAAQRARIAMRTIEDAFLGAQMFMANMPPQNLPNPPYYNFVAKADGDWSSVSFICHIPPSFLGASRFPDEPVRRITFNVQKGKEGGMDLIMEQRPMLLAVNEDYPPYSLTLAKDIQKFMIEYWGQQKETRNYEWSDQWESTNALPKLVRIVVGVGKAGKSGDSQDLIYRVVALPAAAVPPEYQMPMGGGMPGRFGLPPGANGPNVPGQGQGQPLPNTLQPRRLQ